MTGSVRVLRHPAPPGIDPAAHELILTSIHQRLLLRFVYKGRVRIVEPQDYGVQKGVVNLFTYQVGGESGSGRLPDWRKFALNGVANLSLLDQVFPGSRAVPRQKHQEWDVLFARVESA